MFGKALRAARLDRGLTQADLARAAGVHRSHIHLLETGRRGPRLETVLKLGRALAIPADALYARDVIPDQPLARTLQLRVLIALEAVDDADAQKHVPAITRAAASRSAGPR